MRTLTLVLACALPLAAQSRNAQSDSAKAAAIVARHLAAVGGEAAMRAITDYHLVVTMSMPGIANAPEIRSETYVKSPNLIYMKIDMPGIGPMEMGFDGKIAWSMSAATGPTIHDEVPKQLTDAANFNAPPLAGARMSYAGRRQIGGRPFESVRAVLPDSQIATYYFDVATGLMAGLDPEGASPPPDRMSLSFEDYQRAGPILQPRKLTMVAQGQEMVTRTVSISHQPLDRKIFDLPPAVRQLRDKPPQR